MVAYVALSTQSVRFNNQFVVGAKVYVYDAGTNTPRTAYADGLANTEHDWPFVTDANGCIPPFWVVGAAIKVKITTPGGNVIWTINDIPGDSAAASVTPGTGTTIPPGFISPAHTTGVVAGWVRANGRTIGDLGSGATERADADTSDLYTILWNDTLLTVSGGRGASAAADFSAGKLITLPDYRGRALVGLADMGNSTSTRLDSITFATGNNTTLGSTAGAATTTLVEANIPSHTHDGVTSTASSHAHTAGSSTQQPTITVVAVTDHTHTASQDVHSHSYTLTSASAVGVTAGGSGINQVSSSASTTGGAQPTITVAAGGAHTHVATQDSHFHTITVDSNGAHSHTYTTDATGSGTAFENAQPMILTTYYIKL